MNDLLHSREQGTGPTVILLHGFPMNLHVWDEMAEKLSDSYHVVTVDLPGFGKSPGLPDGFTLEDVARTLYRWISEKGFSKPVITGHSLGGYVTLALAEQEPDSLAGICLFHSTAVADSEEKKQARNKALEFIDKQGVEAFTSNFISQLYADAQHSSVTHVKKIAVQSSRTAVKGYTVAMRDRKDRTGVLAGFPRPVLFLAGEKDALIPAETIRHQASLNPLAQAVILPAVAHMGMFEAEGSCLKHIQKFIQKCVVTS